MARVCMAGLIGRHQRRRQLLLLVHTAAARTARTAQRRHAPRAAARRARWSCRAWSLSPAPCAAPLVAGALGGVWWGVMAAQYVRGAGPGGRGAALRLCAHCTAVAEVLTSRVHAAAGGHRNTPRTKQASAPHLVPRPAPATPRRAAPRQAAPFARHPRLRGGGGGARGGTRGARPRASVTGEGAGRGARWRLLLLKQHPPPPPVVGCVRGRHPWDAAAAHATPRRTRTPPTHCQRPLPPAGGRTCRGAP
jgi:hypothetical protein